MERKHTTILVIAFLVLGGAFAAMNLLGSDDELPASVRVVLASDVEWQALNPLRGDKSPRAGTLWGDRGAPVPCGFLVKFVDGFSSPPHIHPVTYRGVVGSGLVHNADPNAEERWLEAGSFWTQPAGEVHITAAKGDENVAYIEIEEGPYLVHPADQAFERPEAPIQMPLSEMSWSDPDGTTPSDDGPKIVELAGNPGNDTLRRTLVRLPAGYVGSIQGDAADLHVVVILGAAEHHAPDHTKKRSLPSGSYFGSTGQAEHVLQADSDEGCLLCIRTAGEFALGAAGS